MMVICEIKLENNSVLSTSVPDRISGVIVRMLVTSVLSTSVPDRISGVIVSMLASSVVDCLFEPHSVHSKD